MAELKEKMIAAGFLKPAEADNIMTVALRAVSIPVVLFFVRLGVHPNLVTALSLLCAGAACWFLSAGQSMAFALLWTGSAILDYADGTVARKLKKASYSGYLLDMFGDRVKLLTLLAVWAHSDASITALVLAALAAGALVATELISHVFVSRSATTRVVTYQGVRLHLYEVFCRFDMHTFVIYGLTLSFSRELGLVGTAWLALVLGANLYREMASRLLRRDGQPVQVNARLLRKVTKSRGN